MKTRFGYTAVETPFTIKYQSLKFQSLALIHKKKKNLKVLRFFTPFAIKDQSLRFFLMLLSKFSLNTPKKKKKLESTTFFMLFSLK